MRPFAASAACLAALAAAAPAAAANRSVLVLNGGNEAIFTLRVGHSATNAWSDDLLGFASVVDVGRGVDVTIDVDPAVCTYDLTATYGDGHTQMQTVDLCTVDRVRFDH